MEASSIILSRLRKAGVYSIMGGCFFTPLSTSIMGIFGALVALFWVISGAIANLPHLLRKSRLTVASLVLILLFIAGMFYSPADWEEILDVFKKYRELFFIPAVISLMLHENVETRDRAVTAFFTGCVILMSVSYLMAVGVIHGDRYGNSLTYHITHSFFMAILAFWTAHRFTDALKTKFVWAWATLLAAVLGNIIFIAPGRTGMLTLFALGVLFIRQRFSWKKQLIALAAFLLLATAVFYTSDNVRNRLDAAVTDIQTYHHGVSRSSLGMRFDWWYGCLELIRERPAFGHGTGSFTMEHDRLIKDTMVKPTDNPHNEYLFIAVQLGLVGLLAYLALFAAAWFDSRKQPPASKYLAQGVIVSMMAGCLANSFLFDSHQGHYFAFLIGLLCVPLAVQHPGD